MDNNQKILIAAIIAILIILVGAFALSGSNNATPSVTPTATPVTATPTPVPSGNPTGASSPTPTVVATPTPVPSVTPTPVPESGVKLTEFGYWITYPPLDPETWSEPKPVPENGNIVYFNPTSATMDPYAEYAADTVSAESYQQTHVYRSGDMDGTVNVTIHMTMSSNIVWEIYETEVSSYDYSASMHGNNLEDLGDGNYKMVFGPGVTDQYVCVHVYSLRKLIGSVGSELFAPSTGWVKLTLTGADGGYSVGANKDFTLSIENLPYVYFEDSNGWITGYDGFESGGNFYNVTETSTTVDVTMWVERTTTEGAMPVNFGYDLDDYGGAKLDGNITIHPFAFVDGHDDGLLTVSFDKDYLMDTDNWCDIYFYVDDGTGYVTDYDEFEVEVNYR